MEEETQSTLLDILQSTLSKIFKKNETTREEKILKTINEFREKYFKEIIYNKAYHIDELFLNDGLTHKFVISNRSDGKTTSTLAVLCYIAVKLGIPFNFIVRHYELRYIIIEDIKETLEMFPEEFDMEKWYLFNHRDAIEFGIDGKPLGLISDLNNAPDLKQQPKLLKKFKILVYDEFITLPDSYINLEYEKLKMIFETSEKEEESLKGFPVKVLYLGNAMNLESPILARMGLIRHMHKLKTNNSFRLGNISVSLIRNDKVNKLKNQDAFPDSQNDSLSASFKISTFGLWETLPTYDYKCIVEITDENCYIIVYMKEGVYYYEYKSNIEEVPDYTDNIRYSSDFTIHINNIKHDSFSIEKYISTGKFLFDSDITKNIVFNHLNINPDKILKKTIKNDVINDISIREYKRNILRFID